MMTHSEYHTFHHIKVCRNAPILLDRDHAASEANNKPMLNPTDIHTSYLENWCI